VNVLALETSGRTGSVALLHDGDKEPQIVAQRRLSPTERTARSLLPTVKELLREHSWRPAQIGLVCTTTGPGSFTGLRIGVVAAKTFAYAVKAHLVGVHTLAAMAEGTGVRAPRLWTVLDAERHELYAAHFTADRAVADQFPTETHILATTAWLEQLKPGDAAAGPPLAKLHEKLPPGIIVVDEAEWQPAAAAVGRLGMELFARGHAIDPLKLVPNYYRKSAAEEKAARSGGGKS